MKSLLSNDYVSVAVRVFIGFVFIFASIDKAADPEAFANSINNYRLLGEGLTTLAATILPWVELLCGIAVIAGIFLRGSALLLTSLLVIFTVAIVSALIRGLDISCGCFTQDPSAGKIGWTKLAENLILIALTTFLFYSTSVKFTLKEYTSSRANIDRTT